MYCKKEFKQYYITSVLVQEKFLALQNQITEIFNKEKIKHLEDLGYHVKNAKIRYIVAWKNKERDDECPVILPEIELERKHE